MIAGIAHPWAAVLAVLGASVGLASLVATATVRSHERRLHALRWPARRP